MLRELHELFLKVFFKSEWIGVIRILGITLILANVSLARLSFSFRPM